MLRRILPNSPCCPARYQVPRITNSVRSGNNCKNFNSIDDRTPCCFITGKGAKKYRQIVRRRFVNAVIQWSLNFQLFLFEFECCAVTAKRKLERRQFSTSSSFVKIWSACNCELKAYFWTFWALYHLLFDLETIGVN